MITEGLSPSVIAFEVFKGFSKGIPKVSLEPNGFINSNILMGDAHLESPKGIPK